MSVKFKKILFVLLTNFVIFNFSTSLVYAQPQDWKLTPRCVGTGVASDVATIQGLECVFYNVLQVIVVLAGLASFIMFIVGGFQYLFSSNDQKAVAQASSTLTMAFIGVAGVILSWFVLNFITSFTGVNVLKFAIPGS